MTRGEVRRSVFTRPLAARVASAVALLIGVMCLGFQAGASAAPRVLGDAATGTGAGTGIVLKVIDARE